MAILGYMSPCLLTPNLMATFSLKKEKRKKEKQTKKKPWTMKPLPRSLAWSPQRQSAMSFWTCRGPPFCTRTLPHWVKRLPFLPFLLWGTRFSLGNFSSSSAHSRKVSQIGSFFWHILAIDLILSLSTQNKLFRPGSTQRDPSLSTGVLLQVSGQTLVL